MVIWMKKRELGELKKRKKRGGGGGEEDWVVKEKRER